MLGLSSRKVGGRRLALPGAGDDHYYLFGLGPDGRPFTADDLLPTLNVPPGSWIGLLKRPVR